MTKINYIIMMISLLAVIFPSCKKKTEAQPDKTLLMTINVVDDYFNPKLGGVIFISDKQGRLLADHFCTENGVYQFHVPAGSNPNPLFEVTSVRIEPYWHSFNILLETYTCINSSEWTFKGYRADTVGQINPVYANIPAHNGSMLISSSGYSNLTFTPGLIPVLLYKSPDDLFISIPTTSGMRYKWFENIYAGSSYTLDLSGALVPEKQTIGFPLSAIYHECTVLGYPDGNFNSPVPYKIAELFGDGKPASGVDVHFPPGKFQGFHTDIMLREDWTSGVQWEYQTDGQIPADFLKISAQVNVKTVTNTRLELTATGNLDAVSGTWEFQSPFQGMVEWTVFGADTATSLSLPDVSPSLMALFPWFSRDSLAYSRTQLYDHTGSPDYQGMINSLFNPARPSSMERLEMSKLVVYPVR